MEVKNASKRCMSDSVGIYPPVRISKDMLYVILLSCGSRRMDSGALDEDLEHTSIYIFESIDFLLYGITLSTQLCTQYLAGDTNRFTLCDRIPVQ
jgi:hypothetical protein